MKSSWFSSRLKKSIRYLTLKPLLHFGTQHKCFMCTSHFVTQNTNKICIKLWDLVKILVLWHLQGYSMKLALFYCLLMWVCRSVEYNDSTGVSQLCQGTSNFTHYCFCISSEKDKYYLENIKKLETIKFDFMNPQKVLGIPRCLQTILWWGE